MPFSKMMATLCFQAVCKKDLDKVWIIIWIIIDYLLSISMHDSWLGCALVNYHVIEISSS